MAIFNNKANETGFMEIEEQDVVGVVETSLPSSPFIDFMRPNVDKVGEIEVQVSDRIKSAFRIRPLSEDEMTTIRKRNTKMVKRPKGGIMEKTDTRSVIQDVTCAAVVYPDLKNAELQKSWDVMGEAALLKAMLLPGEIDDLAGAVMKLSGYDENLDDLVDEAKN